MAYPTVSAPYGFKPINSIGGTPYAGSTRQVPVMAILSNCCLLANVKLSLMALLPLKHLVFVWVSSTPTHRVKPFKPSTLRRLV